MRSPTAGWASNIGSEREGIAGVVERLVWRPPVVGSRWFRENGEWLFLLSLFPRSNPGVSVHTRDSVEYIARVPSTISRELRRNAATRSRRPGVSSDERAVAFGRRASRRR